MPNIILRQGSGNTEPRSANVVVKNISLSNSELDNNFNNINNTIELNSGTVVLAYDQANSAFSSANTKFPSSGGTISGNIIVVGEVSANTYKGNIDAGFF